MTTKDNPTPQHEATDKAPFRQSTDVTSQRSSEPHVGDSDRSEASQDRTGERDLDRSGGREPAEARLKRDAEPRVGDSGPADGAGEEAFRQDAPPDLSERPELPGKVEGAADRHPALGEALKKPEVKSSFEDLWDRSDVGDYDKRHEEGGWIMHDSASDESRVVPVEPGMRDGIRPGPQPDLGPTEKVAGFYHTHPNPSADEQGARWSQGPSDTDKAWSDRTGVPLVVRGESDYHVYYPDESDKS